MDDEPVSDGDRLGRAERFIEVKRRPGNDFRVRLIGTIVAVALRETN